MKRIHTGKTQEELLEMAHDTYQQWISDRTAEFAEWLDMNLGDDELSEYLLCNHGERFHVYQKEDGSLGTFVLGSNTYDPDYLASVCVSGNADGLLSPFIEGWCEPDVWEAEGLRSACDECGSFDYCDHRRDSDGWDVDMLIRYTVENGDVTEYREYLMSMLVESYREGIGLPF